MVHPWCALYLDAFLQKACIAVTPTTICNCFNNAGFRAQTDDPSLKNEDGSPEPGLAYLRDTDEDNDEQLEAFLTYDEQLTTCEHPGVSSTSEENDKDDNEEDNPLLSVPTHAQVLNSFRTIRTFGMLKDDEEMLYTQEKIEAKHQASR